MPDFTERFTGRAGLYALNRPGYPKEVVAALESRIGFTSNWTVADVGSGTGLLSELFLRNHNIVHSVEPNADMRIQAERRLLRNYRGRFYSIDGRAEATTLPSSSVDLIVVGQALHWFDLGKASREFARVLKTAGHICVLYNERVGTSGFMGAYSRLVNSYRSSMPKSAQEINRETLSRLFSRYTTMTFPNSQQLDFDGLVGRLLSASYAPSPDDGPARERLEAAASRMFVRYAKSGRVTLEYRTRAYLGPVRRSLSSPRTA